MYSVIETIKSITDTIRRYEIQSIGHQQCIKIKYIKKGQKYAALTQRAQTSLRCSQMFGKCQHADVTLGHNMYFPKRSSSQFENSVLVFV